MSVESAFCFYVDEAVKELRKQGIRVQTKEEAAALVFTKWASMTIDQKEPYFWVADLANRISSAMSSKKGLSIQKEIQAKNSITKDTEIERAKQRNILLSDWHGKRFTDFVKEIFYVLSFQSYFDFPDPCEYSPCEMTVVRYSLSGGVMNEFHALINSRQAGFNEVQSGKMLSETINRIPAFNFYQGRRDYAELWREFLDFVNPRRTERFPTLFSKISELKKNRACLDVLAKLAGSRNYIPDIFQWEGLASALYELVSQTPPSIDEIAAEAEQSKYKEDMSSMCKHHHAFKCFYCSMLTTKICCARLSELWTSTYQVFVSHDLCGRISTTSSIDAENVQDDNVISIEDEPDDASIKELYHKSKSASVNYVELATGSTKEAKKKEAAACGGEELCLKDVNNEEFSYRSMKQHPPNATQTPFQLSEDKPHDESSFGSACGVAKERTELELKEQVENVDHGELFNIKETHRDDESRFSAAFEAGSKETLQLFRERTLYLSTKHLIRDRESGNLSDAGACGADRIEAADELNKSTEYSNKDDLILPQRKDLYWPREITSEMGEKLSRDDLRELELLDRKLASLMSHSVRTEENYDNSPQEKQLVDEGRSLELNRSSVNEAVEIDTALQSRDAVQPEDSNHNAPVEDLGPSVSHNSQESGDDEESRDSAAAPPYEDGADEL